MAGYFHELPHVDHVTRSRTFPTNHMQGRHYLLSSFIEVFRPTMIDQDQIEIDINQFIASDEQTKCQLWDSDKTWTFGKTILQRLFAHSVPDNRPPQKSDFSGYVRLTEGRLNSFLQFLKHVQAKVKSSCNIVIDPEFTSLLVLLCAEHSSDKEWTSKLTVQVSKEMLLSWMDTVGQNTVSELLAYKGCCKLTLQHLLEKLDRTDWKKNPSAATAFEWIVLNTNYKCFIDGEQRIMIAISLRLVDDFERENSIMGVRCIKHIISNMTRADFRQYELVIYDALKALLYVREPRLITCLVPCLIDVIKKTESDQYCRTVGRYNIPMTWSRYDSVFAMVLAAVEMESRCDVIVAYLQVLPMLLDSFMTLAARFNRRILDLIEKCLATDNEMQRQQPVDRLAVQLTKTFVSCVSNHLDLYAGRLTYVLSRRLVDQDEKDIVTNLRDVVALLEDVKRHCPPVVRRN